MKIGFLLSLTLAATTTTLVGNTITDPYPGTVCGNASCDVIGVTDPSGFPGWTVGGARYDVNNVTVAQVGATLSFTLQFNYDNGDASLAQFPNSAGTANLNVGDVLIYGGGGPTTGGSLLYGIPLTNHDGLTAGTLYSSTSARTADNVLNDSAHTVYRFDYPVWLANGTGIGAFGLTSTNIGGPEVQVSLSHVVSAGDSPEFLGFLGFLGSGGAFVSFSSATCANDVLEGQITNLQGDVPGDVPEPVSSALFGGGLLTIGLWGRRKLRKA